MGVYNSKSGEYAVIRIIGPMQHGMDSAIGELWSIGMGYAMLWNTKHGMDCAIHNNNIWHGICCIGEHWAFWMQGAIKIAVRDWRKVSIGYTQLLDTHN
jgi:hypothetical protein